MNQKQLEFLISLDKDKVDGTIQSMLLALDGKLAGASFEKVAMTLITQLFEEKKFLIKDNIKLSSMVNKGDFK